MMSKIVNWREMGVRYLSQSDSFTLNGQRKAYFVIWIFLWETNDEKNLKNRRQKPKEQINIHQDKLSYTELETTCTNYDDEPN